MTRKLLWAALVVALGSVLSENQQLALAQSSADETNASSGINNPSEQSTDDSGTGSDDNSQSSNSSAANSDSEKNRSSTDEQADDRWNRYDSGQAGRNSQDARDDDRSRSHRRESGDRDQRAYLDQRTNENESHDRSRSWNNRGQADDQRDSHRGRQGHDLRSAIRFGQPTSDGLAIVNVGRGTAFYQGGLRQGDVLISYNGRPIRSEDEFARWAIYQPGERVPVIVLRDGRRETVYIVYEDDRGQSESYGYDSQSSSGSPAYLGVRFDQSVGNAAVVSSVIPGSPAEEAGLQPGDEIVSLNGRRIESARAATRVIASMQPGDRVDIDFSRRMDQQTQAVLERRSGATTASAQYPRAEVQVFRGGPQYDRMNQAEHDQDNLIEEPGNYDDNSRAMDRGSEGRNTRPLLPRLRN